MKPKTNASATQGMRVSSEVSGANRVSSEVLR